MKVIYAIARREIQSYLNSPSVYVLLSVLLFLLGYAFLSALFLSNIASMREFFNIASILLVIFVPALTMRLIAEERKSGTIENLLTLPVRDCEVVLGKFVAALSMMLIAFGLTGFYVFSVSQLATNFNYDQVVAGYVGLILQCSVFISVALLASALGKNQIVAFIVGFVFCLFFFMIDKIAPWLPDAFAVWANYISVDVHSLNLAKGVWDSRDFVFLISLTGFALYLATLRLREKKSWLMTMSILFSLIFINLISREYFVRNYSLSKASAQVMHELNDVMMVNVYLSKNLPSPYSQYVQHVQDLLEEYRAVSNDRLSFELLDPDAELKDLLKEIGIEPIQIRVIDEDQEQTRRVYMAIMIEYKGHQQILPFINLEHLEKDLTLRMRRLIRTKSPIVAVLSDIPRSSISMWKELVSQSVTISDDTTRADALVVAGLRRQVTLELAATIEKFASSGKGVALLMDRVSVDPETFQQGDEEDSEPLKQLLSKRNIILDDVWVADANCATLNSADGVLEYPLIPETSSGLLVPFCSAMKVSADAKILARSSPHSWLEAFPVNTNPRRDWHDDVLVSTGPYVLMAQIGERFFVSGSSAILWDPFMGGANEQVSMNLVDWLVADKLLLAMRARIQSDAPIREDVNSNLKMLIKIGNIFGVPFLLIVYGLIRWRRREWRRLI